MSITDVLFGKPLATSDEHHAHIGVAAGIPIFGLDNLTSAAYGPELAMTLLIPLGVLGVQRYLLPIFTAILILFLILYFSYRQTINAYPNGGGSYTVASENLGETAGLFAAAALMIDYILTAAVGISAGVTALVSAAEGSRFGPPLHNHQLLICLGILVIIALINMRGVRETGFAFMLPTFMFVGTLLLTIGVGAYRVFTEGGHPAPLSALPTAIPTTLIPPIGIWLLLRAFATGCAAMTGIEAVSNGTTAFRAPRSRNANRTLTIIISTLAVLLIGLSWIAKRYGITAMDPDAHNYQSVLSIEVAAVFGRHMMYYLTMGSVLGALAFSANTAFADFPRMARAIASRDFLPHVFLVRGRRLLFSHGIYALTGFTALILIIFNGVTDKLIPLYAIGAFLAFTLSQAGMVKHWITDRGASHRGIKMFLNGLGATATGVTLCVILVTKFTAGAWITAILVPFLIVCMMMVKRHYVGIKLQMAEKCPLNLSNMEQPLVVIPMAGWDKITEKALRFGLLLSTEVKVVHIQSEDTTGDEGLAQVWEDMIMTPIREKGLAKPELVTISSHYRFIVSPLMDYILQLEEENPGRKVAVLLPELVVKRWWENALHNQRVQLLKLLLLLKGNQRIVVVNIPWYL